MIENFIKTFEDNFVKKGLSVNFFDETFLNILRDKLQFIDDCSEVSQQVLSGYSVFVDNISERGRVD